MLSQQRDLNYIVNPRYSFQNSGRSYTEIGSGLQRYSLSRKSAFSRTILVKDNADRIAYLLARELGIHVNYSFKEGLTEKVLFQGSRKAIKSSITFKSSLQNFEFELSKAKMFSFKYQFNWNSETYQWKRMGFGTFSMECICLRTGVKFAEYKSKAMAWKNLGTLEIYHYALRDPVLQSLLLTTCMFLIDISHDS
ncbi:hypothetical protein K493DRAFT_388578 [Basidiobolus meristosporus CBS 931.73]|uniref:Uncharacterized protein n=1 Tax=Basidiobolus meristosporus CBS 931.73 TaxID=1314790 RepID=A0A1Y1XB81_9FUNG|nr:hypothetical protein K493DRAFT_388578 [Basidiobolus meristosporus CBS 931.73]|eukprot:ORX82624.1 hypothetical protein K493DRAFT_388578 [Basidiobolus meristosporus CBS 931.73]